MPTSFDTPILLLIFNRLDPLKLVFEEIKKQKPKYLFISSDGPRQNKQQETSIVKSVREYVLSQIDWDCEVKTLFREENLGCGKAVSGAITWFFENVENGIILEDDCLANESFFTFCKNLLERYKFDERVMHISGNNFQLSDVSIYSYYYTYASSIWGWATWKRAWQHYDFELKDFTSISDFNGFVTDKFEKKFWRKQLKKIKNRKLDTWDYQWQYSCWQNDGLSIMPRVNLVKNIGFGAEGTHTKDQHFVENLKTYQLENISHPPKIERNLKADGWHADILGRRDTGIHSIIIRTFDNLKDKVYNKFTNFNKSKQTFRH